MTTPPTVESDLGWALSAVMRTYLKLTRDALGDVPGGARGYQVLAASARGEPRSQLALANQLGLDRTVMTHLLDALEREGLVERRPDPNDRRARRIVPTAAGGELLCALDRRLAGVEDALLDPLDGGERATLRALLRKVATSGCPAADACTVAAEMDC